MSITKLNLPPTQNEVIEKINEVIDGKQNTLVAGNCIELNQSILPEGYIKYDYLQGGNGAYIDLGIIPTCNVLRVKWKGQLLGSTYGGSFMGCVSGTTPRAGFRIFSNANNGEINIQSYSSLVNVAGGFNVSTVDVTYDNVNATISGTINNINVSQASASINTTLNKNMLLFAAYVGNSVGAASEQKCWELEIEKDGLLVSKLIPCQRVSDSEFGMYDIIRNTFLTNQGTGTFTAGNVVSDETYINFVNNNGFITKAVDDLTNYYTKSQTYTQTEVQQLIAAIPNFSVEVVSSLPAEGEAMTLYLLPKTGTAPDVYEEYVWVTSSSSYELLGTTAVDLTGYLQTSDIVTTISTTSTDATIPSAKCVYDELSAKANDSDVIKKTGTAQQTITATNNTPLGLKTTDSSNTCYMSFNNNNGFRASLGVDNNRKLVFWDKSTLSTVAMTSNIPTIATTLTSSSTNAKTVGAKCAYDALNLKQTKANLVTTISASSTDATYPSAKCVYDSLSGKQDISNLVTSVSASSTDAQYPSAKLFYDTVDEIKTDYLQKSTANSTYQTLDHLVTTIRTSGTDFAYPSENAVKAYAQPKLESGVNIKTLNGYSLLGSGDLLNNTSSIGWDSPVTISGISSGYSFLKCYSNGEFICINGSKVFTSTDGINWTEKGTLPAETDWQLGGLVYGNGTYVVVDTVGFVSTSTDLETWTTPISPDSGEPDYYGIGVEYFGELLFFNGNFHIFGLNGTGVSSDGVNWTISAPLSIITDNNVYHFAYKGGTLIGITDVDSSGVCQVYKSTDYGATWSNTPIEIEFPAEAEGSTLITTTDDKFVIVTSTGYTTTSEDGDTWEEPTYNDNLAPINYRLWVGLAYGNSKLVILSWRREVSIANVNAGKTIIIVNSYNNGTSFCDVYSDGKCIQGGIATGGTTNSGAEILFLKPFADDNYLLLASGLTRSKDNFGTYAVATAKVRNLSTTSFYASTSYRGASSSGAYQPYQFSWLAIGKIGSSS